MMKYLLVLALSFAGDAFAEDTYTQHDKFSNASTNWVTLTCSGFKTWQDCRTQARTICPSGFQIGDQLENILIQRREVSVACKS